LVLSEAGEPLGMLEEFVDECLDRKLESALESARVSVVGQTREQRRQHAVHFELLEVEVGKLLGVKRAVFA
jgi:hypothetical protein